MLSLRLDGEIISTCKVQIILKHREGGRARENRDGDAFRKPRTGGRGVDSFLDRDREWWGVDTSMLYEPEGSDEANGKEGKSATSTWIDPVRQSETEQGREPER